MRCLLLQRDAGLNAEYSEGRPSREEKKKPLVSRIEPNVMLTEKDLPKEVAGRKIFGAQWTGFLTPTETGDFLLGVRSPGFCETDGRRQASRDDVRRRHARSCR